MNKPRGRPFQPGNSFGRGRPTGSRNRGTSAGQRLLEQHHEALMAKQLQAAHSGDLKARQWCLEQAQRNSSAQRRTLKLPPIGGLDDVNQALDIVLESAASGERTPGEVTALLSLIEEKRKTIETQQIVPRIEELERVQKALRNA